MILIECTYLYTICRKNMMQVVLSFGPLEPVSVTGVNSAPGNSLSGQLA